MRPRGSSAAATATGGTSGAASACTPAVGTGGLRLLRVLLPLVAFVSAAAGATTTTPTTTPTQTPAAGAYCGCVPLDPSYHTKAAALYSGSGVPAYLHVGAGSCANAGSTLLAEVAAGDLAACQQACTREPHCVQVRYDQPTRRCLLDAAPCRLDAFDADADEAYAVGAGGRCPSGYQAYDAATRGDCTTAAAAGDRGPHARCIQRACTHAHTHMLGRAAPVRRAPIRFVAAPAQAPGHGPPRVHARAPWGSQAAGKF